MANEGYVYGLGKPLTSMGQTRYRPTVQRNTCAPSAQETFKGIPIAKQLQRLCMWAECLLQLACLLGILHGLMHEELQQLLHSTLLVMALILDLFTLSCRQRNGLNLLPAASFIGASIMILELDVITIIVTNICSNIAFLIWHYESQPTLVKTVF